MDFGQVRRRFGDDPLKNGTDGTHPLVQCRHDEFDFANAADAKLDVAMELVRSNYIALNAALYVGDLLEEIGRCALRINKRLMLPQEFICQLATAGDASRFD